MATAGRPQVPRRARGSRWRLSGRETLTLVLLGAFVWSALQVDWRNDLVHPGGFEVLGDLVRGLATPEFSGEVLGKAAEAAWTTLTFAVAGLSLALILGIPLGVLASGTLVRGARGRSAAFAARTLLSALRTVHELVWAWLFVASIGLSPFAAIFALAIPYAGILGRIYADQLNDVPEPPLRALRSAGASEFAILLHGRMPAAISGMASYTFYRLECGLRSSAIMGFVGISGLGLQIQLSLDDLDYSRAGTFLFVLVGMIALVELWSALLRRRLAP